MDRMINPRQVVAGLIQRYFADAATERRSGERQPCDPAPVRITMEGDLSAIGAHIVYMTKSGFGMRLDRRLTPGAKATVQMNGIIVTGRIRYSTENNESSFEAGFQVDQVSCIS